MPEPAVPSLERILERPEAGARSIVDLALKYDPFRPPAAEQPRRRYARERLHRSVTSNPVPVPRRDWPAVVCGTKRMYRCYSGSHRGNRHARLFPVGEEFPRPAIIYSQIGHARRFDSTLAVITGYRMEPLGAISAADLAAEGFQMLGQFIRYWKLRYATIGWRPDEMISVVELRPWGEHDDEEQGAWLLRRLFGAVL